MDFKLVNVSEPISDIENKITSGDLNGVLVSGFQADNDWFVLQNNVPLSGELLFETLSARVAQIGDGNNKKEALILQARNNESNKLLEVALDKEDFTKSLVIISDYVYEVHFSEVSEITTGEFYQIDKISDVYHSENPATCIINFFRQGRPVVCTVDSILNPDTGENINGLKKNQKFKLVSCSTAFDTSTSLSNIAISFAGTIFSQGYANSASVVLITGLHQPRTPVDRISWNMNILPNSYPENGTSG